MQICSAVVQARDLAVGEPSSRITEQHTGLPRVGLSTPRCATAPFTPGQRSPPTHPTPELTAASAHVLPRLGTWHLALGTWHLAKQPHGHRRDAHVRPRAALRFHVNRSQGVAALARMAAAAAAGRAPRPSLASSSTAGSGRVRRSAPQRSRSVQNLRRHADLFTGSTSGTSSSVYASRRVNGASPRDTLRPGTARASNSSFNRARPERPTTSCAEPHQPGRVVRPAGVLRAATRKSVRLRTDRNARAPVPRPRSSAERGREWC